MFLRHAVIMSPEDVGASGTKVIDLNIREQIAAIYIHWKYTVATVALMTERITADISKVEIVDGGNVLVSLGADDLQALAYYNGHGFPMYKASVLAAVQAECIIPIYFGTSLYDTKNALRPDMFSNLQLKITYDEDAASAAAVVNSMAVYASLHTGNYKNVATGMFINEAVKTFAMAASSHETIKLLTGKPIRNVLVKTLTSDHQTVSMADNIKVQKNGGEMVYVDQNWTNFINVIMGLYPRININAKLSNTAVAQAIYNPCTENQAACVQMDDTPITAAGEIATPTFTGILLSLSASVATLPQNVLIQGYIPHGVVDIPLCDKKDPSTFLNFNDNDQVEVDLTMSSDADSGDTGKVIVEKLLMY